MKLRSWVVGGMVLVLLGVASATTPVKVKRDLVATGVDPDASGRSLAVIRGSDGRFEVKVRRLVGDSSFQIVIDGVPVGTLVTSGGGGGRARFRTRPRGSDQLLGFEPRGTQVEVRDESGEDVLEGDMPDDGMEPDGVRCCLPHEGGDDHEGSECEHLSAAACEAEGGSNVGGGSCLPNPCEPPPPGQDEVRCCLPDGDEDDGAECERRTPELCSLQHGVNRGPGECEPHLCEPRPHPEEIRCCEPDDEGTECEHRTAGDCAERGGVNKGPGMCEPGLCGGENPDSIRCCETHEDETQCEHRTAAQCTEHGGVNKGPGACEPGLCDETSEPDEIRCCELDDEGGPECEHRTAAQCAERGGVNKGPGLCEPGLCEPE